jgi:hypothetical protein
VKNTITAKSVVEGIFEYRVYPLLTQFCEKPDEVKIRKGQFLPHIRQFVILQLDYNAVGR